MTHEWSWQWSQTDMIIHFSFSGGESRWLLEEMQWKWPFESFWIRLSVIWNNVWQKNSIQIVDLRFLGQTMHVCKMLSHQCIAMVVLGRRKHLTFVKIFCEKICKYRYWSSLTTWWPKLKELTLDTFNKLKFCFHCGPSSPQCSGNYRNVKYGVREICLK